MCEDSAELGGFRVPRGCVREYQGAMVAQCTIDHLAPDDGRVREFLASRYGSVHKDGAVLRVQVPGLGTLQVLRDGNRAQFTAIAAEAPPAVDTSATQG